MVGKNAAYLQQYVTRKSPRTLPEEIRRKLAAFFGVDDSQLGGAGDISYAAKPVRDWVEVPRLSLDASAGPGAFAAEELPFDAFGFSARWLRERGLEPKMVSAIAVRGDSMEPLLQDGDEILVDRARRSLKDGVHVVRLGDALLVKRVQTGRPGKLLLVSQNPAYPPIEAALEEVDVIGRVVWKGGSL
jgi:phage repressor protein C with HTH and peptisase S24 domain